MPVPIGDASPAHVTDRPQAMARRRGRPRSERARRAILDAAADLLLEGGLRATSVDDIAARAGVGKATIYKWWPSKEAVAVDAFADRMAAALPLPDTGSAAGDLAAQIRAVTRFYAGPAGRVFAQLVAEGVGDAAVAALFRERFLTTRHQAIRILWDRAVARGEVRGEIDPGVATDVLFGPAIFRLLTGHAPLTDTAADAIASAVLHGLLADKQDRASAVGP